MCHTKSKIKYFITGGGTGGHIYPALAVVRELIAQGADKEADIFYIGNKKNLEYQIAQSEGLNFLHYDVLGMPRKMSFKIFLFATKLFFAIFTALLYVLKYRPDVIFATGGYVCAPILIAARILKIPYVLHDCDAHPGIVSRLFSSGAQAVSFAFESAKSYTECKNVYILGNPIRKDFKELTKVQAKERLAIKESFVLLIMGGSLGAKKINEASISIAKKYANNPDVRIIWQTGKKNFEDTKLMLEKEFVKIPSNITLEPYFENMALPLMASDIAISRAGSLSLSELCAAGLPCILIPYPYAAADHQRQNAKKMCESGAAIYLDDNDCTGENLLKSLEEFTENPEKCSSAAKCAKGNAKYNAAFEIAGLINSSAKNKSRNN